MKKWCGVLGLWFLLVMVACGGNATTVPLPPTVAPSSVPAATARPTDTAMAFMPTAIATISIVTPDITRGATETALPAATALAAMKTPNATATSVAPPDIRSPTNTAVVPTPTVLRGDSAAGAALFQKMGCKSCHMPPPAAKRIAPDLKHVITDADEFIHLAEYKGNATDAVSYIRESIVLPNIFVVPAFRYLTRDGSTIMPLYFSERLSPAQIDDLVSYVLTIPGAN